MNWLLTIIGWNEVFDEEGESESITEYEHKLHFETFKEAIEFIEKIQSHTLRSCAYRLEEN